MAFSALLFTSMATTEPLRRKIKSTSCRFPYLPRSHQHLNEHSALFKPLLNCLIFSSFIHGFTFYAVCCVFLRSANIINKSDRAKYFGIKFPYRLIISLPDGLLLHCYILIISLSDNLLELPLPRRFGYMPFLQQSEQSAGRAISS